MNPLERISCRTSIRTGGQEAAFPKICRLAKSADPTPKFIIRFDDVEHKQRMQTIIRLSANAESFWKSPTRFLCNIKKPIKALRNFRKQNVDYGGGVERLMAAVENKTDIFQTSLFAPIIKAIEEETRQKLRGKQKRDANNCRPFSRFCFY